MIRTTIKVPITPKFYQLFRQKSPPLWRYITLYHRQRMTPDRPSIPSNLPDPLTTIATVLADFETVTALDARDDRYPPRLAVRLTVTDLDNAPGVTDVVDTFDARIKQPRLSTDDTGGIQLQFDLEVPRPLTQDGTPKLRKHGNTQVASLSNDVVARAGFELGEELAVLARAGEIRLIRSNQWPADIEILPEDDLLPAGFHRD